VSRTIAEIVENLIHKDPAQRRSAFESLKNEIHLRSVAAERSPVFGMTAPLEKAEQFLQADADRLRALVVEAPAGLARPDTSKNFGIAWRFRLESCVLGLPGYSRSPDSRIALWVLSLFERHCSSPEDPSVRRSGLVDTVGGAEYSSGA
jgi:hypothetical protein